MTRNIILFVIKFLISAALMYFLSTKLDLKDIGVRLSNLNWVNIYMAGLCFLMLLLSNSARWWVVLSAIDRPHSFNLLFRLQYIGGFFNQVLPSVIGGDALRAYLVHRSGAPLKTAINGIVLERVITVAYLIFLVTLFQPLINFPEGQLTAQFIFPSLSVFAILGIIILTQIYSLPKSLCKWKIIRGLVNLSLDAKSLFLSFPWATKSLFFGFLGNILVCLFTYECAQALGIELELVEALVFVPPAILISTLPISIAGWGVREGMMVGTLSMVGVPEVEAFALSILYGLLMIVCFLPGGVIWLLHRDLKH
jgi:glycosyltransferase 2 family protein